MRRRLPLSQLDIVIPLICSISKAVSPCCDIEKDEQALLDADVLFGCTRLAVGQYPIGQLSEGELVNVCELAKPLGNIIQKEARSISAAVVWRRCRYGHLRAVGGVASAVH